MELHYRMITLSTEDQSNGNYCHITVQVLKLCMVGVF